MNTKIQSKFKRQQHANSNMREPDNEIIDPKIPFENHAWGTIFAWTNVNDKRNPLSILNSLRLPIANQIRPETAQRWKSNLEHTGYNVTIDGKYFVISFN